LAVRIVSELAERPGAEYDTESWHGEVDVGVRVLLKTVGQHGFELGDLPVELGDDRDRGACRGGERVSDGVGSGRQEELVSRAGTSRTTSPPAAPPSTAVDRGPADRALGRGAGIHPDS